MVTTTICNHEYDKSTAPTRRPGYATAPTRRSGLAKHLLGGRGRGFAYAEAQHKPQAAQLGTAGLLQAN